MDDFSDEQKQYLQGLANGLSIAKLARNATPGAVAATTPTGPEAIHIEAQDRTIAAGGKLVAEEQAKRAKHPFDRWDEFRARAQKGEFPKGTDVFMTKFHGLFYVAPAQNSYMIRLRIPCGILNAHQMHGLRGLRQPLPKNKTVQWPEDQPLGSARRTGHHADVLRPQAV